MSLGTVRAVSVFFQEVIAAEKQKLREYFTTGLGREAGIKALYFQIQSDRHEQ